MKSEGNRGISGVFLTSVCVIAAIICALGCRAAARGDFSWPLYAAVLLISSAAGGGIIALSVRRALRERAYALIRAAGGRFN